jgi:mercuric ion binding protein
MKYLFVFLFFTTLFTYAFQKDDPKTLNFTIKVSGVCEMCKSRIEKGTIKLKGVKYANWEIISNNLSLIYNSKKIKLDTIKKKIASLGHDTDKFKAPIDVYENLPDCCHYKTLSIH